MKPPGSVQRRPTVGANVCLQRAAKACQRSGAGISVQPGDSSLKDSTSRVEVNAPVRRDPACRVAEDSDWVLRKVGRNVLLDSPIKQQLHRASDLIKLRRVPDDVPQGGLHGLRTVRVLQG